MRQTGEGEELVGRFFQAASDGFAFQPPFAEKRFAASFHLGSGIRVDDVAGIFAQFVMQTLGRVAEKVAVFSFLA